MTTFELKPEDLKNVLAAALLEAIPKERRETLLRDAVAKIINEAVSRSGGSYGQTGFEQCVTDAFKTYATKLVAEELAKKENHDRLAALAAVSVTKAFETKSGEIVEKVAEAVSRALTGGSRY